MGVWLSFTECSGLSWALADGLLPTSLGTGFISLIFEKGHHHRPLQTLTDLQVLAKVLTKVTGTVVLVDQTCGVPGKSCSLMT